ncbi:hypothetical protein AC578_2187 [Pseudocercospora eumusae]|uniref:Uncharacterized protein n=1 Tax=Pseudocercospora eumusae TaxID=321146 RepID=A0A139HHD3_9PEZI|nr:hypothetical protein AC578_2187 [Pseudocercospora eumusae]
MTVSSYRTEYMPSDSITTPNSLLRLLHPVLEPFVDDANRSRCVVTQLKSGLQMLIPAPFQHKRLISAASAESFQESRGYIEKLKHWLDWASFVERDCLDCALDEVCQLPIWSSGSNEYFELPRRGSAVEHGSGGYWDMMDWKGAQHR